MLQLGLVTCQALPTLPEDEQGLLPIYPEYGIEPHILIWDDPSVQWRNYDALVLRSPWDYTLKFETFQQWLRDTEPVPMWNPRDLIDTNMDKQYLLQLQKQGIPICHTQIYPQYSPIDLRAVFQEWGPFVVKPTVSASGMDTHCFNKHPSESDQHCVTELLERKTLMIQPFYKEIQSQGEYSFNFIGGEFCHAVCKRPAQGQFLIHEAFGGTNHPFQPDAALLHHVQSIVERIPSPWLYARVDGVIHNGTFLLMELELTEPSLYLNYHPQAPQKFVKAVAHLCKSNF